jgi:hypothetical protein
MCKTRAVPVRCAHASGEDPFLSLSLISPTSLMSLFPLAPFLSRSLISLSSVSQKEPGGSSDREQTHEEQEDKLALRRWHKVGRRVRRGGGAVIQSKSSERGGC